MTEPVGRPWFACAWKESRYSLEVIEALDRQILGHFVSTRKMMQFDTCQGLGLSKGGSLRGTKCLPQFNAHEYGFEQQVHQERRRGP
jgi:hypothetical protein